MKLDPGTIITIVVVLLFYLRLMTLQWGKAKRIRAYDESLKVSQGKKGKNKPKELSPMEKYGFKVKSWVWVAVSFVFIGIGVALNAVPGLDPTVKSYWWAGILVGVVILGLDLG